MEKQDWSQKRLEDMIANNAEESIHLDFKAAAALGKEDSKKKEVCKDVSAFANSDGGVIIYGIAEVDHKAHSFNYIDGNAFTKEWLEQVIKDGIQQRIDGVRIHPIRIDNDIKKTIYIVDIPASDLAPHMIKENRYFKRFNFMSVAMEEYEVRQTYSRKKNVKLQVGDVNVFLLKKDINMFQVKFLEYKIELNLRNVGNVIAKDYRIRIFLPKDYGSLSYDHEKFIMTSDMLGDSLSTIANTSIFPNEELSIIHFEIGIPFATPHNNFLLECYLYTETGTLQQVIDIADKVNPLQIQELKRLEDFNKMKRAVMTGMLGSKRNNSF